MKQYIVVNTPASNKMWKKFKAAFPQAEFMAVQPWEAKEKATSFLLMNLNYGKQN